MPCSLETDIPSTASKRRRKPGKKRNAKAAARNRCPIAPARAKSTAAGAQLLSPEELRALGEPYLRGLRPILEKSSALRGCWFVRFGAEAPGVLNAGDPSAEREAGFFVGYLLGNELLPEFAPVPPECMAGAFIAPSGVELHSHLVAAPESLFRETFTYIGWLTHRKPRFVFSEQGPFALARHLSMTEWPAEKRHHLSRNFFIETLAWLVRSGLVKRLLSLPAVATPADLQFAKLQGTIPRR